MKISRFNINILALFSNIFLLMVFFSSATICFSQNADITISGAGGTTTTNGSWTGLTSGTYYFVPTANSAIIKAKDIQDRLEGNGMLAGNVTINTSCASCTQSGSISSPSSIQGHNSSTNQYTLTLFANQDINLQGDIILDAVNGGTNNTPKPGTNFTAQVGRDFIATNISTVGSRKGNNSNGGNGGSITITAGNSISFSNLAGLLRTNGADAGSNTFSGGNAGNISLTAAGPTGGITLNAKVESKGGIGLTTGAGGNAGDITILNLNPTITTSGSNDGLTNTISFWGGTSGTGAAGSNGSLIKTGVGIIKLSGVNDYLGATIINVGTLSVTSIANGGVNSNIGKSSNLPSNLVFNGGTLEINSLTITIDRGFTLGPTCLSRITIPNPASVITFTGSIVAMPTSSDLYIEGSGQFSFSTQTFELNNLAMLVATLKSTSGILTVNGTFVNNGNFIHNSGTIKMGGGGLSSQFITGTSSSVFYNLFVSNSLGVNLGNSQTVVNSLNFVSDGLLSLSSHDLTMSPSASIINTSSTRYIKTSSSGQLKQTVGGMVLFPIGNSAFNPATLNNAGTSDIFGMRVMDNVTDNGTGVGTTSLAAAVKRTWHITEATLGGSNASLTLNWNGTGEEINSFSSGTAFISHYTSGWNNIGGSVSGNAITTSGITSFSPFAITSAFSGLPVELTSFQANCSQSNTVEISWSTASEYNSSHFLLEGSRDGITWELLTKINAAGFSTETLSYEFVDQSGGFVNYYRLIQVDIDGALKSYDPITVNCNYELDNSVVIAPNPGNGNFTLQYFSGSNDDQITMTIFGLNGSKLVTQNLHVVKGMNSFNIYDTKLENGCYLIHISGSSVEEITQRYVKN